MYGNKSQVSIFKMIKKRIGKLLLQRFPSNRIRILGLKLCSFSVGKDVYVGYDTIVASPVSDDSCDLFIGDRVAIAPRVTFVLSSDANYSKLNKIYPPIRGAITLKDDCWIGTGSIILPDVTVGECSIIGAGSVVTKDIPSYSIAVGSPAKVIKNICKEKVCE